MRPKFSLSLKTALLVTCVLSSLAFKAIAAPLDPDKSGEEQVKDAVRKAEAAASAAAEDSVKRGHKAETPSEQEKVTKLGSEIEDDSSLKDGRAAKKVNLLIHHIAHSRNNDDEDGGHTSMRVKEHRVHRKPGLSHLMGMTELGDIGNSNTASYKEDTKLEDRLALEAEEEKKYEDGYGGSQWEDGPAGGSKGGSWSSNIQRQDAAEKQSIQAQVASESAHELNEIQQAVAAESQSSRGATSLGDAGASVVQIGPHNDEQTARFREEESGPRQMEGAASFEAPHIKSFSESSNRMNSGMNSDLSSILRQSTKLSPSELQGPPKQFSSENLGGLSNFGGGQSISRYTQGSQENIPMEMSNSFAGSEASQLSNQLGGASNQMGGASSQLGDASSQLGGASSQLGGASSQLGGATMQEIDPSQKEAFSAGALQGAAMDSGSMRGNAIEMGGSNMQNMQGMGSLSAGFSSEQQQQPLVASMQGMLGGASMQSLGAAAANGMTGMQSFGNMGTGMGGLQSFGGAPMTFKKRSKTAKVEKDNKSSDKKGKNSKKSNLTRHHHRHHHHKSNN